MGSGESVTVTMCPVETRTLNQKVKRNKRRFPSDFMFQMSKEDIEEWKSQIVISKSIKMGLQIEYF
jgi:hypothetical protein